MPSALSALASPAWLRSLVGRMLAFDPHERPQNGKAVLDALAAGEKAQPFVDFAESALEVFQKLVWWVIKLAPIGSAALIGKAIATYGWNAVAPLAWFTADVYIGCAIVLFVLYPALLKAHGLNPVAFFKGAGEAITFAFVSRSSVGTLPITRAALIDKLGVPSEYASFAAPLMVMHRWKLGKRSAR